MKFVFAFNGTRGDIQPAVVIAAELRQRGHDVVFGAPPNLVEYASRLGLDTRSFGYDTRAHMNSDLVRNGPRTGSPRQRLRALGEIRNFGWAQMVDEMHGFCEGADAIVTGFTTEQIAFNFAEASGVPFITLHHAPILANDHVSPLPGASLSLPQWLNRASWSVIDKIFWQLTRDRENTLRGELGLAPATSPLSERMVDYGTIQVQAYDDVFVPKLAEEWGASRPFVGFVDLSAEQRASIGEDGELDAELLSWIAQGSPPIYFGFGSMPVGDPAAVLSTISGVCRELGERALISLGWNEFDTDEQPHLRMIGPIDHARVFPLCKAVVHHGGAGTTAAGIRAGRAAMICWVGSDQPFWGAQLTRMGIGASTALKGLDASRLRAGLGEILTESYQLRARAFVDAVKSPNAAVAAAADVIEGSVVGRHGSHVAARR